MKYDKSVIELEHLEWTDSSFGSYVVQACNNAVKKPINTLELEEIRLLISQNIGVQHILPIALCELEKNVLLEVTYYEGDLLQSVLRIPSEFWSKNPNEYHRLKKIIKNNYDKIKEAGCLEDSVLDDWFLR